MQDRPRPGSAQGGPVPDYAALCVFVLEVVTEACLEPCPLSKCCPAPHPTSRPPEWGQLPSHSAWNLELITRGQSASLHYSPTLSRNGSRVVSRLTRGSQAPLSTPQLPPVSWAASLLQAPCPCLPSPWHCPEDLASRPLPAGPPGLVKRDSGRSLLLGATLCSALGPGVGPRTGGSLLSFCLFGAHLKS